jgi:hypothetical protein
MAFAYEATKLVAATEISDSVMVTDERFRDGTRLYAVQFQTVSRYTLYTCK